MDKHVSIQISVVFSKKSCFDAYTEAKVGEKNFADNKIGNTLKLFEEINN